MWYYTPSRCTAAPNFFLKNVLRRFGIEAASFRPTDTPVQLARPYRRRLPGQQNL